ncbi:MAG: putative lipid II flippase FtsW, partial [Chloroflexia bacterium]
MASEANEEQRSSASTWSAPGSWREALSTKRPSVPDHWLLAVMGGMTIFGLVMLYSASFVEATEQHGGNSMYFLGRQFLWLLVGLCGAAVAMRVDYRFWRRLSVPLMVVVVVLLIAVLVLPPSLAEARGGARRWITLGEISIQPSQLALLVFIIYIADWLSKRGQKLRQLAYGLLPFAMITGLLGALIVSEPDMGTCVVLIAVAALVFLIAGADLRHFGLAGLVVVPIGVVVAYVASYRWQRVLAFLRPFEYRNSIAFHQIQAQIALGTGGLFGVGLGQSRHKFFWVPSPYSDTIFAIIGEELGLIGCLFVVGLYLWLAYRGYTIAVRAPDRFGMLLAAGVTTWICVQAFVHIAAVCGVIPFTGLTLPLISYGGSSLASTLTALGLLVNVSSYEKRDHET